MKSEEETWGNVLWILWTKLLSSFSPAWLQDEHLFAGSSAISAPLALRKIAIGHCVEKMAHLVPVTGALPGTGTAPRLAGLYNLGIYCQKFKELNLHLGQQANPHFSNCPGSLICNMVSLVESYCYSYVHNTYFFLFSGKPIIALLFIVQSFVSCDLLSRVFC